MVIHYCNEFHTLEHNEMQSVFNDKLLPTESEKQVEKNSSISSKSQSE